MFDKLLFQSKFVFRNGGPDRYKGPSESADVNSDKELKGEIQSAKLELATLARKKGFKEMTYKLYETDKDKYFYAATEWAVKSNSAFYSKRDKILRALIFNEDFQKSLPATIYLKKYQIFRPKNIEALLKKLSGRWIMRGIKDIPRPKLPGIVKLMSPGLKAQLKVIAKMKIKQYLGKAQNAQPSSVKAVNYTKSLNKYQKVLDALEGRIQTKPASTNDSAVKNVPYNPPGTNEPIRTDTI